MKKTKGFIALVSLVLIFASIQALMLASSETFITSDSLLQSIITHEQKIYRDYSCIQQITFTIHQRLSPPACENK